jgi:hypothetical protein
MKNNSYTLVFQNFIKLWDIYLFYFRRGYGDCDQNNSLQSSLNHLLLVPVVSKPPGGDGGSKLL